MPTDSNRPGQQDTQDCVSLQLHACLLTPRLPAIQHAMGLVPCHAQPAALSQAEKLFQQICAKSLPIMAQSPQKFGPVSIATSNLHLCHQKRCLAAGVAH